MTAPAASDSPVASESAQSPAAWTAPASCTAMELTFAATLDGAPLGECVSKALASYESGQMHMINGDTSGTVEFSYTPDYSFHGEMSGVGGPQEMTFLDGTMWIDSGDGPVKGDAESENPDEVLVAGIAEMYRMFADPVMTADLIASSPQWKVDTALAQRDLENGESVQAYRLESTEAFEWNGVPVSNMILWFGQDWTPVGTQASISFGGISSTATQQFYDLGKPVEIKAPS